jgi:predicted nucleotide-binding protein
MADEKKKPAPSHHLENAIIVQVPTGATKQDIENQIRAALAEQPDNILATRKSKELVIIVQNEGDWGK